MSFEKNLSVHHAAKRTQSQDYGYLKAQPDNMGYDMQRRRSSAAMIGTDSSTTTTSEDEEQKWLEDLKFGLAHINPIGEIIVKPHKYRLVLDMANFNQEDISIKAVHNGFFVRAAHPEQKEDGSPYITHHFYREYVLPRDIDPTETQSWITPAHILFIEAPKLPYDPEAEDRRSRRSDEDADEDAEEDEGLLPDDASMIAVPVMFRSE